MATANMSLVAPDPGDTDYSTKIDDSFNLVDSHDHTSGKGVQIPTGGIVDLAVTTEKIAAEAVTVTKIPDLEITRAKLEAVGQQVSNSSGSFSTGSSSETDVTNLSVSITTYGRPVILGLIGGSSSVAKIQVSDAPDASNARLLLLRGSDVISNVNFKLGADNLELPPSVFSHIDPVAAGTYTYKVQVVADGGAIVSVTNVKLYAYELK